MFGRHCFKMVWFAIVMILAILSMETLASPLALEVSSEGMQNGNTAEQLGTCAKKGFVCRVESPCCIGLECKPAESMAIYKCH